MKMLGYFIYFNYFNYFNYLFYAAKLCRGRFLCNTYCSYLGEKKSTSFCYRQYEKHGRGMCKKKGAVFLQTSSPQQKAIYW